MRTSHSGLTQQRTGSLARALALVLLAPFVLAANEESASEQSKQTLPFFFSDCSHLVFDSREGEELTRAERIAVLNADIEANLGQYEACMTAAAAASQDRMSDAGSAGAAGAAGGDSGSAEQTAQQSSQAQESENEQQDQTEQTDQAQRDAADPSREHRGSERQAGSSAVCDAIKAGLDEAATESEKEHFKALAKEYGCSS